MHTFTGGIRNMKNNLWKKGLVLGIILLFVGVAIAPGITAAIHLSDATSTKIPESENLNNDLVEITIQICKVDGARFPGSSLFSSEEEVNDTGTIVCPKTGSTFSRGIFNFFSKILDAFPILAGFIERFIPKYPEKPEVAPEPPKEEPKDEIPVPAPETPVEELLKKEKPAEQEDPQEEIPLGLTLKLNEVYKEGDPIPVTATLANIGDEIITVSEMNFKTGTLDFYIDTPDGYEIHFIYPTNDSEMRYWKLKPEESRCIDMDITRGLFGISPSTSDCPYEFKEGYYTIVGYYKSYYVETTPTQVDCYIDVWEGELDSSAYGFTIVG